MIHTTALDTISSLAKQVKQSVPWTRQAEGFYIVGNYHTIRQDGNSWNVITEETIYPFKDFQNAFEFARTEAAIKLLGDLIASQEQPPTP